MFKRYRKKIKKYRMHKMSIRSDPGENIVFAELIYLLLDELYTTTYIYKLNYLLKGFNITEI